MGNVKESMDGAEPKLSNQPETQGSIISERVGQPHVPETTENHLVYIGAGLLNYARQAVLRDWDPNTPRVTDEERKILTRVSRKDKKL